MKFTEEDMVPPWTNKDHDLANAEGWDIFDCDGSDNGRWQICRIDDPQAWKAMFGIQVPQLDSDDDAWLIVIRGTQPHHLAARAFIEAHNIIEWQSLREFAAELEIDL